MFRISHYLLKNALPKQPEAFKLDHLQNKMQGAIDRLELEFRNLRIGRAQPSLNNNILWLNMQV